jgi:hypothetical protein
MRIFLDAASHIGFKKNAQQKMHPYGFVIFLFTHQTKFCSHTVTFLQHLTYKAVLFNCI